MSLGCAYLPRPLAEPQGGRHAGCESAALGGMKSLGIVNCNVHCNLASAAEGAAKGSLVRLASLAEGRVVPPRREPLCLPEGRVAVRGDVARRSTRHSVSSPRSARLLSVRLAASFGRVSGGVGGVNHEIHETHEKGNG